MLSSRAQQYLNAQRRLAEWNPSPADVIAYCRRQQPALNEELIRVQLDYAGYQLTIRRKFGNTFLLSFISKQEVVKNLPLDFIETEEGYLLDFGQHATAQFNFFITNLGELCTLDNTDEDKHNIICSSVEKFIEQYALQNELATAFEDPYYYTVKNADHLDKLLYQEFVRLPECSDDYSHWCSDGLLTIVKGTWIDKPTFYLHVYSVSKEACTHFVERLKAEMLIG